MCGTINCLPYLLKTPVPGMPYLPRPRARAGAHAHAQGPKSGKVWHSVETAGFPRATHTCHTLARYGTALILLLFSCHTYSASFGTLRCSSALGRR